MATKQPRWKTTGYRLPMAEAPVGCEAKGCERMAVIAFVSTAKDQPTKRTTRCAEHAPAVAAKAKIEVPS